MCYYSRSLTPPKSQWFSVLASIFVTYLTLPGDHTLLPLMASGVSVILYAFLQGINLLRAEWQQWYRLALPPPESRFGSGPRLEEGSTAEETVLDEDEDEDLHSLLEDADEVDTQADSLGHQIALY